MKKIVLIACANRKLGYRSKAKDLYISPLFRYNLEYARLLRPNEVFILSAKHGLLDLNKKVEPYNQSLNNMSFKEVKKWADSVLIQLRKIADLEKDEFIFLAGNNYRKFLLPYMKYYKIPMRSLGIGKQLNWLKKRIKNE